MSLGDALEAHEAELEFDRAATGLDIGPLYPLPDEVFASLLVHLDTEPVAARRHHLVEMVSKHVAALRKETRLAQTQAALDRQRVYAARDAARDLVDALEMDIGME